MDDQLLVHFMDDVLMWHAATASAPGGTIQTAKLCSKHIKREHKLTCLKLRSVTTVGAIASDIMGCTVSHTVQSTGQGNSSHRSAQVFH